MTTFDPSALVGGTGASSFDPSALVSAPQFDPKKIVTKNTPSTPTAAFKPVAGKQPRWLFSVGQADTLGDYRTDWKSFGKGGIRPQFRSLVDAIGNAGFTMGIYDFNRGHHYAPNDPHLDGRAMDVDYINNEGVGTQLTPKVDAFIKQVMSESPNTRVGVPQQIFDKLHGTYGDRMFVDNPYHIHVELTPQGVSNPVFGAVAQQATQHFDPKHLAAHPSDTPDFTVNTLVAGVPMPVSRGEMEAFARTLAKGEATIRGAAALYQRIPVSLIADKLGALQRGVGMGLSEVEHGDVDPLQIGRAIWHGISDASTGEVATHAADALIEHILPIFHSKQDVHDMLAQTDIPKQLQYYINAGYGATEDFTAQTLTDPLTYLGGLGLIGKGVRLGIRGLGAAAHGLEAFDDWAQAARAAQRVRLAGQPLLRQVVTPLAATARASATVRLLSGAAAKFAKGAGTIRPELEDFSNLKGGHVGGFTDVGKDRRMSIERSEAARRNTASAADAEAFRTGDNKAISQRYLDMMYWHGSPKDSALAARLLGRSPNATTTGYLTGLKGVSDVNSVNRDILSIGHPTSVYSAQEAQTAMDAARSRIRQYRLADRTMNMIGKSPGAVKAGTTITSREDWRRVPGSAPRMGGHPFFASVRELQRSFVMLFPFIHGLGNVGQLTYLSKYSGGLRIIPKALHYMLGETSAGKFGPMVDRLRLQRIGAAATYVHEQEAGAVWGAIGEHLGAPGKWAENYVVKMQKALTIMEDGWRQSLLDALDANKATKGLDELRKGALVAQHVGDPSNVPAFVRLFEYLGGPFVAYRLGIVPRAVLDAIGENPQRVLAAIRPQLDIQENRSEQARNANVFEMGGPVADASRLFGPGYLSYLLSPSTIGFLGDAFQLSRDDADRHAWASMLANVVGWFNPFSSVWKAASWMLPQDPKSYDAPMPGQHKSLTDSLMGSVMGTITSFYFAKQMNERYEHQQEHKNYKEAMQIYEHWLDLFYGPRHP